MAEVESQVIVYGFVVPDEPIFVPSSLNWTLSIPEPASKFDAVKVTELPLTVAPLEGEVTETLGAIVSTTMVLLVERLTAGLKLVIGLPSVEVAEPVIEETFNVLALSLPPMV